MRRDAKRGDEEGEWQREHIIRLAVGGPDTYPNLIPICKQCNLGMGKTVMCTYDYMVRIGRMSAEQAQSELSCHRQRCAQFDPRCEASLASSSSSNKRCSNLKPGRNEIHCSKHINAQLQPMDCTVD
jgi:hypothetical protein